MLLLLACTTEPPAATKPATAEVLVVGIHGMGDSPERFDGLWEPPSGFRELHPRGTQAYGAGWRWFPARREGPGDEEIAQAAEHIAGLIEAEGQKAVVYGFSQGGALTMALTVQHPELVERGGQMMVPYLIDPNTGTEMYESEEIIAYLNHTYG